MSTRLDHQIKALNTAVKIGYNDGCQVYVEGTAATTLAKAALRMK